MNSGNPSDPDSLDPVLLEQLLDELLNSLPEAPATETEVSPQIINQVSQESSADLQRFISSLFARTSWSHVEQHLLPSPEVCLSCLSTTCIHFNNYYASPTLSPAPLSLWTDHDLALYAGADEYQRLVQGLHN